MMRFFFLLILLFSSPGHTQTTEWTCSMHPQIRMPDDSEKCPICHMDLIPVSGLDARDMDSIPMNSALQSRIQTKRLTSGMIEKTSRIRARVIARDSFHQVHSLRSAGRIENLRISRAGLRIQTGDLLYELYSPTLITAQQDYLEARKIQGEFGKKQQRDSRIKLLWLGFHESLLKTLENRQFPLELVPIYADSSGLATEVFQTSGAFAPLGANVFRYLKDEKMQLEAYLTEADFRTLQSVTEGLFVPLGNLPEITLSHPVLEDLASGPNRSFRMLWEMSSSLPLGTEGTLNAITRFGPGSKVPNTALLFAGQKAVIFMLRDGKIKSAKVNLLHSGDNESIIEGKLSPQDAIVTHGAFAVDSEFQIQGKNSFIQKLTPSQFAGNSLSERPLAILIEHITEDYLMMWQGLSDDDLSTSQSALKAIRHHMRTMDSPRSQELTSELDQLGDSTEFKNLRAQFHHLSELMLEGAEKGFLDGKGLSRAYCPMALDYEGAGWIQLGNEILNPYFGHSMLHCGSIEEELR